MEIGEKILRERKAAGLSQRQLCGDRITRNMLSQIEHGTARPSMDTLVYLARRLGKPVGCFLDDEEEGSSGQKRMEQIRNAEDSRQALELLRSIACSDASHNWEWKYRMAAALTASAQQAVEEDRAPYARQLLEEAREYTMDFPELERQRLLALGSVPGMAAEAVSALPDLDMELLLRAEAALEGKKPERAMALLEAAQDHTQPRWLLLRGRALMDLGQYASGARCLEQARDAYPEICFSLLEVCYRELGDYKQAYYYACRQTRK